VAPGDELAWLDLRPVGLGDGSDVVLIAVARVALDAALASGPGGAGHARSDLACDPGMLVEAVRRVLAYVVTCA
jgi:cystathionine beta-lyase